MRIRSPFAMVASLVTELGADPPGGARELCPRGRREGVVRTDGGQDHHADRVAPPAKDRRFEGAELGLRA